MTHIKLYKLALDALHSIAKAGLDLDEYVNNNLTSLQKVADDAIAALQAAITAEESAEPVLWLLRDGKAKWVEYEDPAASSALPKEYISTPLYTHPPVPEPLSDEEIRNLWNIYDNDEIDFARAVITASRSKT
jgi:hypothetical protein